MAHITIDASHTGVVMQCRDCGTWYGFAFDLAEAHDRAVGHENRTHPGEDHAAHARREWRRRARKAAPSTP